MIPPMMSMLFLILHFNDEHLIVCRDEVPRRSTRIAVNKFIKSDVSPSAQPSPTGDPLPTNTAATKGPISVRRKRGRPSAKPAEEQPSKKCKTNTTEQRGQQGEVEGTEAARQEELKKEKLKEQWRKSNQKRREKEAQQKEARRAKDKERRERKHKEKKETDSNEAQKAEKKKKQQEPKSKEEGTSYEYTTVIITY